MPQDFQEVSLIDEEDALKRLGGNATIYTMLLRKFTENTYIQQLDDALGTGNTEEAAVIAHTIKGLAANLSLHRLQSAATELDKVYKEHSDPAGLPEILKHIYTDTMTAVKAYIG